MTMKALAGHSLARGTASVQRAASVVKVPTVAAVSPFAIQRGLVSLHAYEQETRARPTRGGRDDRRGGSSRKGGKSTQAAEEEEVGDEEYSEDIFGRSGSNATASSSSSSSSAPAAPPARTADTAGSEQASAGGYNRGYNISASSGGGERRQYNNGGASSSQQSTSDGYNQGYNGGSNNNGSGAAADGTAAGGARQYNGDRPTRQFNGGGGERVSRQYNGSGAGGAEGERRPYNRSYNNGSAGGGEGQDGQFNGRQRTTGSRPQLRNMTPEDLAQREESNMAVKAAVTWQDVAGVLEARKDKLDAEHITTLFTKAAKNQPEGETDLVQYKALIAALYGWVSACLPSLRPRSTVACLQNVAKVRYFNRELVDGLVKRTQEVMGNLAGYDYSNVISALAALDHHPGDEWMQLYLSYSRKCLVELKGYEIAQLLNALVKLQVRPDAEWFAKAAEASARQMNHVDNFQWTSILYGMAYCGYDGGDGTFLATFTADHSWVGQLYSGQIYQAVWALTQFEQRPKPEFVNALLAAFQSKLRRCSNAELAMISYSLAYLRAQPSPDFLTQLVKIMDQKRTELTGDELANLVMSLGIWQYQGSVKTVEDMLISIKSKLPETSMDGLIKLQNGLPLLGNFNRLHMVRGEVEQYIAAQQQAVAAETAAAAEYAAAQDQATAAAQDQATADEAGAAVAPAEEQERTPELAATY